jgi:hypothetical protein
MSDQVLVDHRGRSIRLSNERWQHILGHPEITGQQERIGETLSAPDIVIATPQDDSVHVYHRLYDKTPVTRKYLVVAVKYLEKDAFVLTAYFTSRVRRGTVAWRK